MDTSSKGEQDGHASPPLLSPPGHYAFLNHSAATLPNNLPPTVDNKPLARQRRRRTSPDDQAILEASYARDPKPDKAARLELVNQVALGEKEVQIWFQNRRQSSRRRSRPLLPHEIAQYHLSRSYQIPHPEAISNSDQSDESLVSLRSDGDNSSPKIEVQPSSAANEGQEPNAANGSEQSLEVHVLKYPSSRSGVTASLPSVAGITGSVGFLANRRSASFRLFDQPTVHDGPSPSSFDRTEPMSQPSTTPSFVRLSMTSEGNAKIITKNTSSPSPPRPQQMPPSIDMKSGRIKMSISNLSSEAVPTTEHRLERTSSGRSRDSRAWQFWCDKDARVELETQAEKDASGSAADAIGLMRSNSGRAVLGAVPSKRNAVVSRQHGPSSKRSKIDDMRPTLNKSYTAPSTAVNTKQSNYTKPSAKGLLKLSDAKSMYITNNESDKENWSPVTDEFPQSDAISEGASTFQQTTLAKHAQPVSHVRASTRQAEELSSDDQRYDPDADDEIRAFMQSGRKSSSISAVEDLDCIQGLLSLSQGNWR